ncbi:MAG: biotin--[acetyl-CoA-carboxylase] ligase [Acidimicrobiaceae bacterium]|nr:biotin--[acetyl-CoA-carboxylase] ligase [Acidimicrobiaceae bacterium]
MEASSRYRDKRFGSEARNLGETRFRLEYVGETGSTNADLVKRANQGASEGLVLIAGHQTTGRGRLNRRWTAPPGTNLLFSVLLRPDWPANRLRLATSALAVSLVDALHLHLEGTGVSASVKWPNDVLLVGSDQPSCNDGKLAGVLAELIEVDPPVVVVGMGVNVNWPVAGDEAPPGATSLASAGLNLAPMVLVGEILEGFESWCTLLGQECGARDLREAHLRRSDTVGQQVSVELASGPVNGMAADLGLDGGLVLDVSGAKFEVRSGDVIHLRTTSEDDPA